MKTYLGTKLKGWWKRRQIDKAQALIESYGLTIVKLHEVAGTTYVVNADGSYMKLVKSGRK